MAEITATSQLALDTILRKPTKGIASWFLNVMEWEHIERIAGTEPGSYPKRPEEVYIAMERNLGTCMLDQYLYDNPLTMRNKGFEGRARGATTGAEEIVLNGMVIDSPEAVVEHMERFAFPSLRSSAENYDEDARVKRIIENESAIQEKLGPGILKGPYGAIAMPALAYGAYGYVNYFSAWAMYPEVFEKNFALQADLALRNNRAAARAFQEAGLPPFSRLDHDMADSRGTLVSVESLDEIWFPHLARCLEPVLRAGVKMLWHCDGNLMQMVPRLLEVGLSGFQGFQYEDGMDYEKICRMKTREGDDLLIIAGVSVTRTLPMGTPADVKREMEFLVEHGPKTGLFLGGSSSITPGVPWENMQTLWDGLIHYRDHGRS